MKNKLGCAIIGAGNVAAKHVAALKKTKTIDVIGISRRDESKAREFAQKYDIDWTTNYHDFFKNDNVDIIDIVLPSGLHAPVGIEAANAGKHVIVEKPIDVTLEKADALIKACEKNKVKLCVISQYRFMDGMQRMYDILEKKQLGQLVQGDAYIKWFRPQSYYDSGEWRGTRDLDGGGPFMNQGIHFIDLLLSAMGPVKSVSAKAKTTAHQIEVEDIGMAMLEFKNGAYGVIQASTATYPGLPARLDIHGTKGTLVIKGDRLSFLHIEGKEPEYSADINSGGAANPMDIDITPFVRQFQDIVSAINNNCSPRVNGKEARNALQLVLAVYQSAQTNKPVFLS